MSLKYSSIYFKILILLIIFLISFEVFHSLKNIIARRNVSQNDFFRYFWIDNIQVLFNPYTSYGTGQHILRKLLNDTWQFLQHIAKEKNMLMCLRRYQISCLWKLHQFFNRITINVFSNTKIDILRVPYLFNREN